MDGRPLDLAALLAPVGEETFLTTFYEQRPLRVHRGDPGYYGRLLEPAEVDFLVAALDLSITDRSAPRIRLVKRNTELPRAAYTRKDGYADLDKVHAAYELGHTLVLNAMHSRSPAAWSLCRSLERRLSHPCGTNLYLTPPGEQGFGVHYDMHDVFFLQITGKKRWRLFAPAVELPFEDHVEHRPDAVHGEQIDELELGAGDLLYIPRGFAHEGTAGEEASLHLSVHIKAYTWADALAEALSALAHEDVRFRRALPPGFAREDAASGAAAAVLADLLDAFCRSVSAEGTLRRMKNRLAKDWFQWPLTRWAAPRGLDAIDLDTPVRRPADVVCRLTESEGAVIFHRLGRSLKCPATAASALKFIAGAGVFTARDLPGPLDGPSRLVLVRRLVEEGYLLAFGEGGAAHGDPRAAGGDPP